MDPKVDQKELRNRIAELLGIKLTAKSPEDLSAFTPEQLAEAETKARELFTEAKEGKDLDAARSAQQVVLSVKEESASRAKAEADTDAELAELEAGIAATTEEPPADPEPTPDPEPEVTPEPAADPEPAPEPEVTPPAPDAPVEVNVEAIAASVAAILDKKSPKPTVVPDPSPVPEPTNVVRITASAEVKGHSAGTEMKPGDLANAFVSKGKALMGMAGREGSSPATPIATLEWDYPEDRQLDLHDHADVTTEKINKQVLAAQARTNEILASIRTVGSDIGKLVTLTAAGGLCAPVNVRYDIFSVGSTSRPLRDGLNRFNANRGGIQYNKPPTIFSVPNSVAVYEEADDKTGSRYPKDCLSVGCGDLVQVKVGAVTLCMKVGNFQRLSFPENFQSWWQLGRVWHARTAETRLWSRMVTEAEDLTDTLAIGASRAILAIIARAAAQYRDRHRIDEETPLRVFMPSWVPDLMQIDLLLQAPGDSAMAVPDAEIARYFANFNVAVTYVMDGQPASAGATYVQAPSGPLNHFPTHADFVLAIDGTLLFLDMGTLDFGTEIRDFTLIRSNDTGAFMETFENFTNVGPDFERITISGLCADGITAGPDASLTCAS